MRFQLLGAVDVLDNGSRIPSGGRSSAWFWPTSYSGQTRWSRRTP